MLRHGTPNKKTLSDKSADILIFVLGIIQQHVGPRLMLQGVQDTYDTYPMTKSSPGEEKSILVLIGKNLDGQLLQSDFDRIINEDTNAF